MGKILNSVVLSLTGIILGATVTGCNTVGCTENQNSLPLAGFYSKATGQPVSISNISVGGVGAPNDSLLYESGTMLSQIYLPLRSTTSTTVYRLIYTEAGKPQSLLAEDEITFNYMTEPWFASEECGAMYRYRITALTYTRNQIDSIGLTDSLITNADIERIRIYFRDSAPRMEGGDE